MRFSLVFLAFCLAFQAGIAHAQESVDTETPRDQIIQQLRPAQEIETTPEPLVLIEPEEIEQIEPEPEIEAQDDAIAKKPFSKLAPFYLSAEAYLEQRGTEKHAQLVMIYDVTTSEFGDENPGEAKPYILRIGADYVSVKTGETQKIYDFKYNRFLEIKPEIQPTDNASWRLLFDNTSLFAKAYRSLSIVNKMTKKGELRNIQIGENDTLDAFWLESSMSWAATSLDPPLTLDNRDDLLFASKDDNGIFKATFDSETHGDAFQNDGFKDSFFAFAHHEWPLYPTILQALYAYDTPPQSLDMVSFGPGAPKGQRQSWVLTDVAIEDARFPLPLDAKSAVERQPVAPLAFVINEAVHNRALGGIQSLEDIEDEFAKAADSKDNYAQWVAGQKYNSYTGSCEGGPSPWICEALNKIDHKSRINNLGLFDTKTNKLAEFKTGVELAKNKKTSAKALKKLQPYLEDPDAPAIILRSAAMARASMKPQTAKAAGVSLIKADALLNRALATDPYDPNTYLGLAQVFAANGAYEQSWDIYDALRAGIPTVDAVPLKIDSVEKQLQASAAGYFLVK